MDPTIHTRQSSEQIVEAILPDVRKGRMVILVDDEDRENEGDLFVAAERATPEAINFMANEGRGLVSLALTEQRMRALGLQLFDEPLKRHVLMRVSAEGRFPHLPEQLLEARVVVEVCLEHDHVDEKPDERFELRAIAAGDRSADEDIFLFGVTAEQCVKAGHQRHEERRTLAPAEVTQ